MVTISALWEAPADEAEPGEIEADWLGGLLEAAALSLAVLSGLVLCLCAGLLVALG